MIPWKQVYLGGDACDFGVGTGQGEKEFTPYGLSEFSEEEDEKPNTPQGREVFASSALTDLVEC